MTEPHAIYGLLSTIILALLGYLKWRHGKKSNVQVILEKQIEDLKKEKEKQINDLKKDNVDLKAEMKALNRELKRVSPTRNKLKKSDKKPN